MKMLILALLSAGLFTACENCGDDLYRCAYERPKVFCWENYDEEDRCDRSCGYGTYSASPIYVKKAYVRVYKAPVYNYYRCPR